MTTRAEAIRLALFAAVKTGAAASNGALPAPFRNRALEHGLQQIANGAHTWLNLVDSGKPERVGEELGQGGGGLKEFNLPIRIEWIVHTPDDVAREAAYDAGLEALGAILRDDPTLGGTCDDLDIEEPDGADTVLAGLPQFKSCEFTVRCLFAAPDFLS